MDFVNVAGAGRACWSTKRVHGAFAWTWPVLVAVGTGFVWGADTRWVALAPCVFGAWWWARTRAHAFVVAFAYHLVAARSLVLGAERYFETSRPLALLTISLGAAAIALVWCAWWSDRERTAALGWAAVRFAGLWVTTYAPGIGAIAVGTPLCAAGIWTPGLGWLGLVSLFAMSLFAREVYGLGAMATIACAAAMTWSSPRAAPVAAITTRLEPSRSEFDWERQWQVANASIDLASSSRAGAVILPEGAAGLWERPMQRLWEPLRRSSGRLVVAGAAVERRDGRFDNVALMLGQGRTKIYRQRAPMPLAMWTPGSMHGFAAHWAGRGTVAVDGRRWGFAICWEAALAWPLLQSVAEGADILVVLANTAWLPPDALRALAQGAESWGALFSLPVAISANVRA